jgi:translation initiation factor IF-2
MSDKLIKVYELAKETGTDSLSLLDRLKTLGIVVKSHMSELSDADAAKVRASFKKPSSGSKKSTVSKPKTSRVRKKASGTQTEAPKEETPASERKGSGMIIRRRAASKTESKEREGLSEDTVETKALPEDTSNVLVASLPAEITEGAESVTPPDQAAVDHHDDGSALEGPDKEAVEADRNIPQVEEPQPTEKKKPTKAPIVLTPRPVAPRRSILKIVEATAPPPRPMIKPTQPTGQGTGRPSLRGSSTQDKDGFRVIKMTKENLDQMAEEEAAKKRGGGPKEQEIRPEDVRFADYRKKELVFLPKKKKIPVGKEIKKTKITVAKAQKRVVEMGDFVSVQNLAAQLSVKAVDIVRKLMSLGQVATINQTLDVDTATLVAQEYQFEVRNTAFKEEALFEPEAGEETETLASRPPVVTIMGHVDHGKTTLLDAIRESNVVGGEAGGITQHIGAYTIVRNGKAITFIDTPGHEAFTVMRARGANVTDIVILVVSADDGVMPQTREAISHAQAAKVPIIVAVNKIDKPGANPEKIKQALAELNLLAEDWGGETQFVHVSALQRTNLDGLLEAIQLQSELLELKANPHTQVLATILESKLAKGRGPVVTALISKGTLRVGDAIVAGSFAGKVRALSDDLGQSIQEASPGFAVEVLGLEGIPSAGDVLRSVKTDADARVVATHRQDQERQRTAGLQSKVSLEELSAKIQAGDVKELNVILKADVYGSVEAIRDSLTKLSSDKVKIKVLLASAGGITESDVLLASASNALIFGFNVRPETKARKLAEAEHVEIKCYSIIYELMSELKQAMAGMLESKKIERFLGRAEIRQVFTVPKMGTIAGTSVVDGKVLRGSNIRLLRESRVIYEGRMSSLRRFKDDVKEVATGYECGIGIENYQDLKPGDIIEAFQVDLIAPEIGDL